MILVDTNVVIDVIEKDPRWFQWSLDRMVEAVAVGETVVNPIVLAECAARFESVEEQLESLATLGLVVVDIDAGAAFAAGHAFNRYRKSQRDRTAILADFLIGGHAQMLGASMLTRDPRFYARYFPSVPLICPLKDHDD